MRYLITGGGGFLGSELVAELVKVKKNEVYIFDNFVAGSSNKLPRDKIKEAIVGNIKDFYCISRAVERAKPDIVIHLASYTTRPETLGEFRMCGEVNYIGTANLLEACLREKCKPRRIIFSSSEAVRNPTSHHGISKRAAEKLLESVCPLAKIELGILRFSEIYGISAVQSSNSLVNFLVDNMVTGRPVAVFDVTKQKDYIHISDAVTACKLAVKASNPFFNVDIGTGVPITSKDLVEKLRNLTGTLGEFKYLQHDSVRVYDSVSNTAPAKEILKFEAKANFDIELGKLIKKRKKDLA